MEGDKIYMVGGKPNKLSKDFTAFDLATSTSSPLPELPSNTTHHRIVIYDRRVYVLGAKGSQLTLDQYDIATNTWTSLTPSSINRNNFAAIAVNNKIYVIGGLSDQVSKILRNSNGYLAR
jgi:hypothetical protein